MTNPTNEELISAYLDGELDPSETERVEQWLAADPAARQLLEELETVGNSLRALPRESLGDDFSDEVLARAERAMLLDGHSSAARQSARDWIRTRDSWYRRASRPLIYAAVTVAAALLVMLAGRLAQDPNDVTSIAQRTAEERSSVDDSAASRDAGLSGSDLEDSPTASRSDPATGTGNRPSVMAKGGANITATEEDDAPEMEASNDAELGRELPVSAGAPPGDTAARGTMLNLASRQPSVVVVVEVADGKDALSDDQLSQPFASNGIEWRPLADANNRSLGLDDAQTTDESVGRAKVARTEEATESDLRSSGEPDSPGSPSGLAARVILVDAEVKQIEQVLVDLRNNARQFPTIDVEPVGDNMRANAWANTYRRQPETLYATPGEQRSRRSLDRGALEMLLDNVAAAKPRPSADAEDAPSQRQDTDGVASAQQTAKMRRRAQAQPLDVHFTPQQLVAIDEGASAAEPGVEVREALSAERPVLFVFVPADAAAESSSSAAPDKEK